MLEISSSNGWVLVTALAAGAVGGLTAAMMLLDPSEHGGDVPVGSSAARVVAIRTLVGAVAAVAFLFFFPVETTTTVTRAKVAVVHTTYPFLQVVALGLIVGSGGAAFLQAMQSKVSSRLAASAADGRTATVREVAKSALAATPGLVSAIAREQATTAAGDTRRVAADRLDEVAAGLPPGTAGIRLGGARPLSEALATTTGRAFVEADPSGALGAIADELGPLPEALAGQVQDAVQAHVDQVIAQLDAI